MDDKNLFSLTNPVFKTAKGSFTMYSKSGDKDAEKIFEELNFSNQSNSSEIPEQAIKYIIKAMPGLIGNVESRYETTNKLIEALDKPNVVDLPCGYMPRGMRFAKKHKNYIGLDLPVVISDISEAVLKNIDADNKDYAHYYGVDATNYQSLRKAFNDVKGELCITTEGMLMYFNNSELDAVCSNIYRLLSEFGGCWITFDRYSKQHSNATVIAYLDEDAEKDFHSLNTVVNTLSNGKTSSNILYDDDENKAMEFMNKHGLKVEKVPFSKYTAPLRSMAKLNIKEEKLAQLNKEYDEISIWIMTVDEGFTPENKSSSNGEMKLEYKVCDNVLTLSIGGRLDSISSPELLSLYKEISKSNIVDKVVFDLCNLEYVSSSGRRTIRLISSELNNNAEIINASDSIKGIL